MKKHYKKNDLNNLKFKEIEFAPQVAIEQDQDLAEQFLFKIFGVEGAWISDESSVYDFEINDEEIHHNTKDTLKKYRTSMA